MLRYLTAGESHGKAIVALIDGFPAGVIIDTAPIDVELRRRQGGYGRGGRQRIETDTVEILSGMWHNTTLGSPIALQVINKDAKLERLEDLDRPRPGHADLTGAMKYLGSVRAVLERASARETTVRVAAGALAKQLLAEFGIAVLGYVVELGGVKIESQPGTIDEHRKLRDESIIYSLNPKQDEAVQAADRRRRQRWRHAGRHRRSARRRLAVRLGQPHAVGSQARWPAGPGGDVDAGDQGSRDWTGLRGGAAARLAGARSDSVRRSRSARSRILGSCAPRTTPADWKPA